MVLLGLKAHVPLTTLESIRACGNNASSGPYGSFGLMAPTYLIAPMAPLAFMATTGAMPSISVMAPAALAASMALMALMPPIVLMFLMSP